jgi:radical SAM superfamily enzyme YgiQ (UPF0313 family)
MAALKAALPGIVTVYGGVHPTYHAPDILAHHPEVDVIVRGEGEATAAELVQAGIVRVSVASNSACSERSHLSASQSRSGGSSPCNGAAVQLTRIVGGRPALV